MSEPTGKPVFDAVDGVAKYESITNVTGHHATALSLHGVGVWACECGKAGHSKYGRDGAWFRMDDHCKQFKNQEVQ